MTRKKQTKYFFLFISPWIIGFLAFTIYPMLSSLFFSLTDYDALTAPVFVGLENYKEVLHDPILKISVKATLWYTLLNVPIGLLLSLLLAMLLNATRRCKGFFRTVLYLPSMVSGVSLALLWSWIFNPEYGVANYLLGKLGIQGPLWLMDEKWAVPSLAIMSFWSIGTGIVLFLAALQGVPRSLTEAAVLDGANWYMRLRHVTLPMISPIFLFQLIIEFINSFQVFTQAFVMTKGGPHYATNFYVYYIYQNAFVNFRMGYASALSWILLAVVMIVTVLIMKCSDRFVYYEGGDN
ncbi:MAG: sugar ABC transporter permease [Lachnospiraceae bacterium]|nr:sugar ABC transporter permease [Lachnospiraceae bacterium]